MSKSSDKREELQSEHSHGGVPHTHVDLAALATPTMKWAYQCPACTNTAIIASNKMLGVEVNCGACGKSIILDNLERYREIK